MKLFFEETAVALQRLMQARSAKYRVTRVLNNKYTIEIIVDPMTGIYDRKVMCQFDSVISFTTAVIAEVRPGQFGPDLRGSSTTSLDVDPEQLALAISRAFLPANDLY
jgi:hypothetical protein